MPRFLNSGFSGISQTGCQGILDLDTCPYTWVQRTAGTLEQQENIFSPCKNRGAVMGMKGRLTREPDYAPANGQWMRQ